MQGMVKGGNSPASELEFAVRDLGAEQGCHNAARIAPRPARPDDADSA